MTAQVFKQAVFLSHRYLPRQEVPVQRVIGFTDALEEYGWRATVVTARRPGAEEFDRSKANPMAPGVRVLPTRTVEAPNLFGLTGQVLLPDRHAGWIPFARRKGLHWIRQLACQAIVGCAPPFSSAVAAHLISEESGIPCVIDLGDEDFDPAVLDGIRSPVRRMGQQRLAARVFEAAAVITVAHERLRDHLAVAHPSVAERVVVLGSEHDHEYAARLAGILETLVDEDELDLPGS